MQPGGWRFEPARLQRVEEERAKKVRAGLWTNALGVVYCVARLDTGAGGMQQSGRREVRVVARTSPLPRCGAAAFFDN